MTRVDELLALIDDPSRPAVDPGDDDDPLLGLLVHLAFSDEVLQEDELALLERVRPGRSPAELVEWCLEVSAEPFDFAALTAALPTVEERWTAMRLAARMICMDGDLDDLELKDLSRLADAFEMDGDAVRTVVREVIAEAGTPHPDHLMRSLAGMFWEDLVPEHGGVTSELALVVPDGAEPICTMNFGEIEVAGLYMEGLAAHFESGADFVPWESVERYTRVPVPGAALHLRLEDGSTRSVADPRLRDLAQLLDRIYGIEAVEADAGPPGGL
jgi:uncharacterized tellurite resistance protein B-like protein